MRAIYGPHVCGGALDITADGSTVLTGSWRAEDQLELWDFSSGKRLEVIPWRRAGLQEPHCLLYSARFSSAHRDPLIAAGGSCGAAHEGEAKIIEGGTLQDEDRKIEKRCAGTLTKFTCLSVSFASETSGLVACGGSDGRVRVLRVLPAAAGA